MELRNCSKIISRLVIMRCSLSVDLQYHGRPTPKGTPQFLTQSDPPQPLPAVTQSLSRLVLLSVRAILTNVAFAGYCQYGSLLTNPTLLSYCQYECKAIPNPSSQSSASQELSVLLAVLC